MWNVVCVLQEKGMQKWEYIDRWNCIYETKSRKVSSSSSSFFYSFIYWLNVQRYKDTNSTHEHELNTLEYLAVVNRCGKSLRAFNIQCNNTKIKLREKMLGVWLEVIDDNGKWNVFCSYSFIYMQQTLEKANTCGNIC